MTETCRCSCGYTCEGPGRCPLLVMECIEKHYVKDCEHDWSGPWKEIDGGGTVTCAKCGMSAMGHDMVVGP